MSSNVDKAGQSLICTDALSAGERAELTALGMLSKDSRVVPYAAPSPEGRELQAIEKKAMSADTVLNEAYSYPRPSSFSRGVRVDLDDCVLLFVSGTASVDESGKTVHVGDFRAQCWRTYRNITELLRSEGATWHDVVRATCYLRDIERDYKDFNEVRTAFLRWLGLDPLPASTGVQARLCREDLLVEIEVIAVLRRETVYKGPQLTDNSS